MLFMVVISYFYPRSPCGERRHAARAVFAAVNFYPRSPCGERQKQRRQHKPFLLFLSTLSLRRATTYIVMEATEVEFLSTLSLRRATHLPGNEWDHIPISIHALLAESDSCPAGRCTHPAGISIHALLAESDN